MSSDKHNVTIVHRNALKGTLSASSTHCFSQSSAEQDVWLSSKWCTSLKLKRNSSALKCVLPYLAALRGYGKCIASLAELGADSSGKLWAEVDKDIKVAACSLTDGG